MTVADDADIAHLLRRTEFVARQTRIDELKVKTLPEAVDNILDFAPNNNTQIPGSINYHDSNNSYSQWVTAFNWWHDLMASRPRPFQEKMTLFWHGHFVSEWQVVGRTDHMTQQNQLYRTSALGNFLTLTQQMSLEPAMLLYLSNGVNVKTAPNENFARELLELFTLGVGNYSEADVTAAARAWTGHNYDYPSKAYEYRSTKHDNGDKVFFGQTRNWNGPDIVNEVLRDNAGKRLIAARLIARKLWEYLAYPKPAANIVNELGDAFIAANLEIKPLVRALLLRPEFYTTEAKQGLVRTPAEWSVALLACSGLTSSAVGLLNYADRMGQTIWNPPNVAGWKNNSYWLTTSGLSGRAAVAKKVASLMRANGGFDNLYSMSTGDSVDFVSRYFGVFPLAPSTRTSLVDTYQAERAASNGSNSKAVTNLLVMTMLTGEMNVG